MSGEPFTTSKVPTLAAMTEGQLLKSLSLAMGEVDKKAIFACGGRIPVVLEPPINSSGTFTPRTASKVMDQLIATEPVTIRYGPQGEGQTLRLPTNTARDPAFLKLISTCEPATFGIGGKDVYDESYRKATKLDTNEFCSNFCPYRAGIVDVVTQLLMPGINNDVVQYAERLQKLTPETSSVSIEMVQSSVEALFTATSGCAGVDDHVVCKTITSCSPPELLAIAQAYRAKYHRSLEEIIMGRIQGAMRDVLLDILVAAKVEEIMKRRANNQSNETNPAGKGIRAELYKLNVYSGPSGRFKAHVDTPRSESQIGSLVVCLPSEFEGGNLAVRHKDKIIDFDWSSSSNPKPSIQWAAFYSDCEHEVHEVTAGHRITLTYNLYASRGTGLLAGQKHSMDPTRLPLYQPLVDVIEAPGFMTKGGTLAIGLSHFYPYTHDKLHQSMPAALKGVDMMLYEALLASKLDFKFVRTMQEEPNNDIDVDSETESYNEDGAEGCVIYQEGFPGMTISSDMEVEGLNELPSDLGEWTPIERDEFKWLRGSRYPGTKEIETAFIAYGNQAEMSIKYSQAAILITFPPFSRRKSPGKKTES